MQSNMTRIEHEPIPSWQGSNRRPQPPLQAEAARQAYTRTVHYRGCGRRSCGDSPRLGVWVAPPPVLVGPAEVSGEQSGAEGLVPVFIL